MASKSKATDDEGGNEQQPDKALTAEITAQHISLLARTGNGLSHAYTRLEIHGKGLTNIDLLGDSYPHLRYLDLSENFIKDVACLGSLEYLLSVNFQSNRIKSVPAALEKRKYLQQANFSDNRIESFDVACWPLCIWLNLNNNKLTHLHLAEFLELKHLEARGNQLTTTSGLNTPKLEHLYLASNLISEITGLQDKQHLSVLHLRGNQIAQLDGFPEGLKSLTTINLRENKISNPDELLKLNVLPNLKNISLSENPVAELENYRLEVIYRLPKIEKLDKDPVIPEEREEAEQLKLDREEQARAEAEEMARIAAEGGGAADGEGDGGGGGGDNEDA